MRKISTLTLAAGLALAAGLLQVPAPAHAHECPPNSGDLLRPFAPGDERVNFCRGTGSDTNPYVELDLPISGACGHWREHYVARPPRTQHPDIFPEGFLSPAPSLCAV